MWYKTARIIKIAFKIKNWTEADDLPSPKSIGIVTVPLCISGPNLVILAWMGDKLSRVQAKNGINLDFFLLSFTWKVKVDQPSKQ